MAEQRAATAATAAARQQAAAERQAAVDQAAADKQAVIKQAALDKKWAGFRDTVQKNQDLKTAFDKRQFDV